MVVTLQLAADAAESLRSGGARGREQADLLEAVSRYQAVLRPQHPRVKDPRLATYFMVDVADADQARRFVEEVRQLASVEAAFVKPADAMPGAACETPPIKS